MSTETSIIECFDLNKVYDEGPSPVHVLRDVNFSINAGEQIAIVGASGSGKSTLLHLLAGLDAPTSGRVEVLGQDLSKINEDERGRIRNQTMGFVYQFHHLLMEFSALENVAIPLLLQDHSIEQVMDMSSEILDKVGLSHRKDHKPHELSGGERQRAAIARALATKPKCVLTDEPTGNLDSKTAADVYDLMLELNQVYQTSFVVVTHDLSFAEKMDKVLHLTDGKLIS